MINYIWLFTIFLLSIVEAATIQGTVYDTTLEPQKNAVIEIDTTPQQRIVSKDGSYNLDVPVGTYTIKASYFVNNVLRASVNATLEIKDNGAYNLDLILFPLIELDDEISDDSDLNIPQNTRPFILILSVFVIIIILIILIYIFLRKNKKKKQVNLEGDLEKIIKMLKDKGKRMTQKEIRKELGLSEAKISLMIADLESQGIVKKIKKGRGNIIVLAKD